MDTAYERFEIVRIASGFRLFDDDSFQRRYARADNVPLQVGLYVVHWPASVRLRRFDEHAQFQGPFESPAAARAALLALQTRAADDALHAARPPRQDYDFIVPWAAGG